MTRLLHLNLIMVCDKVAGCDLQVEKDLSMSDSSGREFSPCLLQNVDTVTCAKLREHIASDIPNRSMSSLANCVHSNGCNYELSMINI